MPDSASATTTSAAETRAGAAVAALHVEEVLARRVARPASVMKFVASEAMPRPPCGFY